MIQSQSANDTQPAQSRQQILSAKSAPTWVSVYWVETTTASDRSVDLLQSMGSGHSLEQFVQIGTWSCMGDRLYFMRPSEHLRLAGRFALFGGIAGFCLIQAVPAQDIPVPVREADSPEQSANGEKLTHLSRGRRPFCARQSGSQTQSRDRANSRWRPVPVD